MRKIASLLTVLLCSSAFVFAQSQVKGKVVDSKDGTPLSSISVKVKGADGGTSTDPDGSFTIDIGKSSGTLEFTGVGYTAKSVKVTVGETISVSLEKNTQNLGEVVVTALGIKREKRSLGYATQTVGSEQLSKSGTGNTFSELSGKVAGLSVINSSGDPGSGTYIQLRGATTITGQNQPLIVVDGIPLDNSNNNYDPSNAGFQASGPNADLTGGATATNRGLDMNPNDIESITVLKGPAATALYGSQASAGALIITTKKGTSGKRGTSVALSSSVTFDRVSNLPALQNTFAQGDGGQYQGPETHQGVSWGAAIDTLSWDGDATYAYDKHGAIVGNSDPTAKTPVTPYNQYNFFKTGITYDNNVSLSGSTDKGGYRMSVGNIFQTGIIPLSKYLKSTFSVNGNTKLTDKLTISGGITYVNSLNNKPLQGSNTSGVMLGLTRTTPTFDNANGLSDPEDNPASYELADGSQRSYRGGAAYDNPYWSVAKNPFTSGVDRVFGFGQANFDMFKWLTIAERVGGDVYTQSDKQGYDVGSNTGFGTTGNIFLIDFGSREFNNNFTLNLHKTLNKDLSGSLILGHDYLYNLNTIRFLSGTTFALPGFIDISNASSVQGGETETHQASQAYFADLELNYKNMLYLGLTGRQENSSTLPADNNSYFFPSASLGWVFTELQSLKNNILTFGKLRATYAETGRGTFPYVTTTPYTAAAFHDGFTSGITFPISGVPGYQISSGITTIGNASILPERGKSYELGADLTFFKGRMGLNATYYETKTTDVIFQSSVSYTTGFAGKILNGAVLDNKGIELTLNTTPILTQSGFRWDLNFNWAHNKNIVKELPGGIPYFLGGFGGGEAGIFVIQGQPFGVIYGDVTPHTVLTDLSSPLLIDDNPNDPNQYQPLAAGVGPSLVIGDPNPKWTGAVISNMTYKGLTIGVQFDIKHGGDVWNGTRGALANKGTAKETSNRGQAVTFKGLLGHLDNAGDVVHFDGSGNEVAGPGAANTTASTYSEFYWQNVGNSFGGGQETDVEDGSYTKLRQVSLTYELPKSFVTKAHFTGLSVTIFANNIYTWTKYDGVDPETNLAGASSQQGLDYFNNPSTKSYGIRLNLGL